VIVKRESQQMTRLAGHISACFCIEVMATTSSWRLAAGAASRRKLLEKNDNFFLDNIAGLH
jgi:hypothetical protein